MATYFVETYNILYILLYTLYTFHYYITFLGHTVEFISIITFKIINIQTATKH